MRIKVFTILFGETLDRHFWLVERDSNVQNSLSNTPKPFSAKDFQSNNPSLANPVTVANLSFVRHILKSSGKSQMGSWRTMVTPMVASSHLGTDSLSHSITRTYLKRTWREIINYPFHFHLPVVFYHRTCSTCAQKSTKAQSCMRAVCEREKLQAWLLPAIWDSSHI